MARQSMTGFATCEGLNANLSWQWEIRSVNGKGLDLKLRLADGFEQLERDIRHSIAGAISRGNVSLSLKVKASAGQVAPRINPVVLEAVLQSIKATNAAAETHGIDTYPTNAADLISLRGVLEFSAEEPISDQDKIDATNQLPTLLASFLAARHDEGTAIARILSGQLDSIERLTNAAATSAEARQTHTGEVLSRKVKALLAITDLADEARLQQELALLAIKADVTEEIDRLIAHIAAARKLLEHDKPIGRRLDFLMQEFNREANTLCAKSGSTDLTTIGLDLKTVIDQMREQVQNLE